MPTTAAPYSASVDGTMPSIILAVIG